MGRKIPTRKHMGVRDPDKQRQQREKLLKAKREDAPPDDFSQPIPKKLAHILKLSKLIEEGKIVEKSRKKKAGKKNNISHEENELLRTDNFAGGTGNTLPGMKRPLKHLPTLTMRPGENKRSFLHRVNMWTENIVKESKFESQFGVDIVRDADTGQVKALEKRKKDEIDKIAEKEALKARLTAQKESGQKPKKSKKKLAEEIAAKEAKKKKNIERMKRNRTKLLEKAHKREEEKDQFPVRETIKFGEVVDRPPEFTVLPRKAIDEKNLKNLMFNQMLLQGKNAEKGNNSVEKGSRVTEGKSEPSKKSTGKLKDLPPGQRRQIEQQQKIAIAAYRLLKAKKAKAAE